MKEWEHPISPQTLVEQINTEGAVWGLVGEYDEAAQTVYVCEKRPEVTAENGVAYVEEGAELRRICSVDDAHPFSAVLANRITNVEAIRPQEGRNRLFEERQAAHAAAQLEAHAHEVKAATRLKRNGGAMFYDGMGELLYRNRAERRLREAIRRKMGR